MTDIHQNKFPRQPIMSNFDELTSRRLLSLLLLLIPALTGAQDLPSGFSRKLVVSGLNNPTAFARAPDHRTFVAEQGGELRVITAAPHSLLSQPFVTLNVDSSGERGLLGVAFHPDFELNQLVYVYHTVPGNPSHNRISRFVANGNKAVPGSKDVILELNNLSSAFHNGGAIHFGLDGKLYVGVGENANENNAQTLSNLLGKLLRLNPDGTIPTDNPFYTQTTGKNRAIWALGLRNPFTFAIQPGTGAININDVGQKTWEEINKGTAGSNYGWPIYEGKESDPDFKGPFYAYKHTQGCAIVGGAFYNPEQVRFPPSYVGDYFFADLCNGWIRRYDKATKTAVTFATGFTSLVDLLVSEDGLLWVLDRGTGKVWKIDR